MKTFRSPRHRPPSSAAVRGGLRLFVRWDHAFVRGQFSASRPGADRHRLCARHRRVSARRRGECGVDENLARERISRARTLRHTGEVSAIGIGVNEREVLLEAMEWGAWDAFLLAGRYTLLEQAPLGDLLPKCVAVGTSIVVGGPLNSGILAGRDTWNYRPAPTEVIDRVRAIAAVCDSHRVPLAAAALQFPLAHPAVAAIIPGPRNADEFRANVGLLRHPIPAALWADLRQAGLLHPEAPVPRP